MWEQLNDDRNLLLKVIEIEQENFNERLKRTKDKFNIIGYNRIDIDRWVEDEFEDIDVMNSWSKFRIIECRLSIGRKDFELTRIGTKNRIR